MAITNNLEPDVLSPGTIAENIAKAGEAAAGLLPSTSPLVAGVPTPAALLATSAWAGAAVARLNLASGAQVGILVGEELVAALASSPIGELDLGAALQPALDAAGAAFGTTAHAAETLDAETIALVLDEAAATVPLLAGGATAAVLFVLTPEPAPATATAPQQSRPRAGTVATTVRPGIEILHGVAMEVTVELGRTRMSVRDLLALTPGDVLELDRAAGSPADLLVNGRLIARGEVVVVDENFALRVTEIVPTTIAG